MALKRSQFLFNVAANKSVCREHYLLVLRCSEGFPRTLPGQFVQILCRGTDDYAGDGGGAFLRRPFSLAGRRDQADGSCEIDIIHRVVGVGTKWMSQLREGDLVSILGPLGNTFTLPAADETALLVGGGVGIPPMLYLAEALRVAKRNGIAFCGATTKDLLPLKANAPPRADGEPILCIEEFSRHGMNSVISTDDGTLGRRGYVTDAIESFLNRKSQIANRKFQIYTCGPELMMKRVVEIGLAHKIPVHVAVERAMACGMGTCQSCCIRVKAPEAADNWRYKLACTDGPVFSGESLLW